MSKPSDRESSSSSSHNNRITPSFFGSPSLYQPSSSTNEGNKKDLAEFPPKAENPYWNDATNPPPPYSPAPNEPTSPQSVSTDPSAPPLEIDPSAPTPNDFIQNDNNGNYPLPQQQQHQSQQPYPPQGYYGALPYPYQPISTSDAGISNWPWIAPPPSATGQPLLVYHPSQRQLAPPGEYENYSAPPSKKNKRNCCELSVQYFFYFFCICLVIRLIGLLSDNVSLGGSCSHGVVWNDLPKEFQYDAGLVVNVLGGELTGGHIIIKNLEDSVSAVEGVKGRIKPTVMYSPASMAKSDEFFYTETRIFNGTVLEIHVPQNLPSRACVSLNAIIYVPKKTNFLLVDVQNSRIEVTDHRMIVDTLQLKTTNQRIEFRTTWEGSELALTTTNSLIDVDHTIKDSKSVILTTSNGSIRTRCPIKAKELISMTTANGEIDADDTLKSDQVVNLSTSNAHVNAHNVSAVAFYAKTTNGRININHSYISLALYVQTTNGELNLALNEGKNTEVVAHTSNAGIETQFPRDFEGTFEVSTSTHNKIKLIDHRDWTHISFLGNGQTYGNRFAPGHIPNNSSGKITVVTTNSNAAVQFGSNLEIL